MTRDDAKAVGGCLGTCGRALIMGFLLYVIYHFAVKLW